MDERSPSPVPSPDDGGQRIKVLVPVAESDTVELLARCARRVRPDAELVALPLSAPLDPGASIRALPDATGDPVRAILDAALRERVSLIAMACEAHLPRWTRLRPLAEGVLRGASVPVLVFKPIPALVARLEAPLDRILVPLDGSLPADGVLPQVISLARLHQAEAVLLHVEQLQRANDWRTQSLLIEEVAEAVDVPPEDLAELGYPRRALERLGERHGRLLDAGIRTRSEVALGDVVEQIRNHAAQADLVVISKSGMRLDGDQHWFGSVAKHLLRSTLVPLIVCPAGESARLPRPALESGEERVDPPPETPGPRG